MVKPKFQAIISRGELIFNDRSVKKYLTSFKEDQEVDVTISRRYKRRTSAQPGEETNFNGYYWGVVVKIIADEIGEFDKEGYGRIHEMIQWAVNNTKHMPNGIEVTAGTSEMSGAEFAEYCKKARMWANQPDSITQKGIYVPEPYECDY